MAFEVGNYICYRQLGRGAFGTVYKARRKGQTTDYALKQISIDTNNIEREVNTQRDLPRSRFVVSLVDHFFTLEHMNLVLDYCNRGTLTNYMTSETVSDKLRVGFMQDMIKGLKHLHDHRIVHRDIKPDNILLHVDAGDERPICKLSDFGLARYNGRETDTYYDENYYLHSGVGTLYYIAPEVLTRHYTEACDIFSLGVVFYALYAGPNGTPFYRSSPTCNTCRVETAVKDKAIANCIKDMVQIDYHMRVSIGDLDTNFGNATTGWCIIL